MSFSTRRDEFRVLSAKGASTKPKLFGPRVHAESDIEVFPVQLLKRPISASALEAAIAL